MGRSTSRAAAQDHFIQVVLLPLAIRQFAIDVLHHHDGAVNDDPKIYGADREQVRIDVMRVQENKAE